MLIGSHTCAHTLTLHTHTGNVLMYTHPHNDTHTCPHISAHLHTCSHTYTQMLTPRAHTPNLHSVLHTHIYAHIHVHILKQHAVCSHMCSLMLTYTLMHVYMHTQAHVHAYIYTYTHTTFKCTLMHRCSHTAPPSMGGAGKMASGKRPWGLEVGVGLSGPWQGTRTNRQLIGNEV